jgi:hypothetical protein
METADLAICAQKSFLGYLKRIFPIAQHSEDDRVNLLMVTGDEFLKRTHLSGLALLDQLPVSQLHGDPVP